MKVWNLVSWLGKIIKIVVTRCQILKCTKFNFGWGSAPDPAVGAYSAPPGPLPGLRGPTSKGRGGNGKGRGKGREGRGREGEGEPRGGKRTRPHPFTPPNPYFWIHPWPGPGTGEPNSRKFHKRFAAYWLPLARLSIVDSNKYYD